MVRKNNTLRARPLHIETGGINIAVLLDREANDLDLKHMDRVIIKSGSKKVVCSIDITKKSLKKVSVNINGGRGK